MRRYETIVIVDPDLQDDVRNDLFDKFTNLLAQEKGILVAIDDWGNRKLAYEIKKKPRGHYICMTYGGDGAVVAELERNFRLDDKVLKFMTVLLEKDVEPEALEEEAKAEKVVVDAAGDDDTEDDSEAVESEDNDDDDDTEEDN